MLMGVKFEWNGNSYLWPVVTKSVMVARRVQLQHQSMLCCNAVLSKEHSSVTVILGLPQCMHASALIAGAIMIIMLLYRYIQSNLLRLQVWFET